jgi:alpha-tubulin suppressor-like RCC1 family protein
VPCVARADAVIANTDGVFSNARSLVDSYRSQLGAYGGTNVGNDGNVRAATNIVHNGGVIDGTLTPNSPAGLVVVPVPAGAANLPLGSPSPGNLNIASAAQSITLAPGTYAAANVTVSSPGAINISPPGSVLIWVTGTLNLGGNENLNGIPENLQFLVTSSAPVNVNAGGRLFGFLYAPASTVNLSSMVFGSVVGASVTLNSGSAVHFDESSVCPSNQAKQVSMGQSAACAVTVAGGVLCWGLNDFGQLGNGTTTASSVPVPVAGLTSGVTAVVMGFSSACAITSGGGVMCWGENGAGQLGNGTTTDSAVPVPVTGLSSGVTSVSIGAGTACAVKAGGAVVCWGNNQDGLLGDNSGVSSSVPVQVVGLTAGASAASVGSLSVCAIASGGTVECWGNNTGGQLGNGTTTNSPVPVQVVGLSGVTAVSVGSAVACAIAPGGDARCWGSGASGALGNNSTVDSSVPVQVVGLTSGVSSISAGVVGSSACAVAAGGRAVCWGANASGGLGNNSTVDSSVPVQVVGLTSGVSAVTAGLEAACALTTTGAIECWGANGAGQLGNNTTTNSLVPVPVVGFP